jgi:chromate reductase
MIITLISGTNRINSNTARVTRQYQALLRERGHESSLLDLSSLDAACFGPCEEQYLHPDLREVQETLIRPATHLLIAAPEYNGSIPGILKALIDFTEIKAWKGKKACLVGVATGRAGNLRGLDHLTNILLHCQIAVLPNKLPISRVATLLNASGELDEATLKAAGRQLDEFLAF